MSPEANAAVTFKPNAWGKAERDGQLHALQAHSFYVAAVFEALCALPLIGRHLRLVAGRDLSAADFARLSALVYLHDLGKREPGFQAKARPELRCRADINHSVHGLLGLMRAYDEQSDPLHAIVQEIGDWGDGVIELMMAIFAHHGRPVEATSSYAATRDVPGYDRQGAIIDYLELWHRAWPDRSAAQPLPATPGFVHLIAGLTALADWIGSDRRFFEFVI